MRSLCVVLVCLLVVTFLNLPVGANPIEITLTNYSIFQDNQPVDDSINLSVKCYGSYNEYRLKAMGMSKNNKSTNNPELVYSNSISCEPKNCYKVDIGNPAWGTIISSCDLEGTYKGMSFFVKNFTTTPEPICFSIGRWHFNGTARYYVFSFEDGNYCRGKYRSDLIDSELPFCYESHSRPFNSTAIIRYNPTQYCEKRFDIPSINRTSQESANLTRNTYTPQSPVVSLYCSILSLFGTRC